MRFVLYTEKTVAQCLTAINDRMQVKATSTRPALDGWVEKGGAFALSLTTPVIGKFTRRTTLNAQAERETGITIIRGSVPSGAPREGQAVVFIALVLVALTIIGSGNVLIGLLLIPVAAYLYIPLHGDYRNSDVLLDEVQKTLKAKLSPPKPATDPKQAKAPAEKKSPAPKPAKSTTTTTKAAKSTTTAAKSAKPKTTKPEAAKSTGTTKSAKPSTPKPRPSAATPGASSTEKAPSATATPPGDEFPLFSGEAPALPEPRPSGPGRSAAPAKKTPPAEKKPPAPPADEFPEVPGEAPP